MALTRAQLRAIVQKTTGQDSSDMESHINTSLDLGLRSLCSRYDFRDMRSEPDDLSIGADDESVSLPTGTHHLLEARLIDGTNSYRLSIKTKGWLTKRYPNISSRSTNRPVCAYIENGSLFPYPISNESYSIRLSVSILPTFASDSTELSVAVLESPLISWATAFIFEMMQQFESAPAWKQRSFLEFEEAKLSDMRDNTDRSHDGARRTDRVEENKIEDFLTPFISLDV